MARYALPIALLIALVDAVLFVAVCRFRGARLWISLASVPVTAALVYLVLAGVLR